MKKIKVHILRKVYLGHYETKELGGEIEFEIEDDEGYKELFVNTYKEFDQMIEKLADQEAKNNKDRRKKELNKVRNKVKKIVEEDD